MDILVTGACGYLGSHQIRHLVENTNHRVWALDIEGSDQTILADGVEDCYLLPREGAQGPACAKILKTCRPKAIFHIASLVRVTDEVTQLSDLLRSNIELGCHLVQQGAVNGLEYVVNTGSFWEEMDEPGVYSPVDLYAATKRAFQDLLTYFSSIHNLRAITLRPFGIFGPGDKRPNIFSYLDESSDTGSNVLLSPGEQVLELIYVKDLVQAYCHALDALAKVKPSTVLPPVDVGTGEALTLKEVVAVYQKLRGLKCNVTWGGRSYRDREVFNRSANLNSMQKILNWRPSFTIESAFTDMFSE